MWCVERNYFSAVNTGIEYPVTVYTAYLIMKNVSYMYPTNFAGNSYFLFTSNTTGNATGGRGGLSTNSTFDRFFEVSYKYFEALRY